MLKQKRQWRKHSKLFPLSYLSKWWFWNWICVESVIQRTSCQHAQGNSSLYWVSHYSSDMSEHTCVWFFNLRSFWKAKVLVRTVAVYLKHCWTIWMSFSVNLKLTNILFDTYSFPWKLQCCPEGQTVGLKLYDHYNFHTHFFSFF